jgi:hypothetical protein
MYSQESILLVAGDHTRTVQIATPTIGGLMKFAVKTVTCLGCKTPLKTNKGMLAVRDAPAVRDHADVLHPKMVLYARTVVRDSESCIRST